jgi:hypothetical protein
MLSVYLTLSYDCNYSEANNNQTEACATIGNAPDIPRIGTAFFRRRKDNKVCDQITAVCHNVAISAFAAASALAKFLHQAAV